MKLKSTVKHLDTFIIFIIAFLFSLQVANHPWKAEVPMTDSSVFIYIGRELLNGQMPYRDLFDHKGPLIYLINLLAIIMHPRTGLWILEIVNIYISFLFIYKAAQLVSNKWSSIMTLIVISSALMQWFGNGNYTESWALSFLTISNYIFADYFLNNNVSKYRVFVCGLCFGAVCLLRINMVILWVVMCLGVLWKCIQNKTTKDILWFLLYFIGGVIFIVFPIIIWLIVNNAFVDFINCYFVFNFEYATFKSNTAWTSFLMLHYKNPIILVTEIIMLHLLLKTKTFYGLLNLLCTIGTILAISSPGNMFYHYIIIFTIVMIYPFSLLFGNIYNKIYIHKLKVFILCTLIIIISVFWTNTLIGKEIFTEYKQPRTQTTLEITSIVLENTNEQDKIIVCGNHNAVYIYANRESVSRYSYQSPIIYISQTIKDTLFNDLETSQPKIIIIFKEEVEMNWFEDFLSTYHYVMIKENLNANYVIYLKN